MMIKYLLLKFYKWMMHKKALYGDEKMHPIWRQVKSIMKAAAGIGGAWYPSHPGLLGRIGIVAA